MPCNACTDPKRCDRAGLCQAFAKQQLPTPTEEQQEERGRAVMNRPSMSMFLTAADYNAAMDEWLASEKQREVGERMAFEAHMKDKLGTRPTPDGAGSYAVTEVRWAWEAWQARAACPVGVSVGAPTVRQSSNQRDEKE